MPSTSVIAKWFEDNWYVKPQYANYLASVSARRTEQEQEQKKRDIESAKRLDKFHKKQKGK
jgi:hypothetical protein